jgi:hypothetical protein
LSYLSVEGTFVIRLEQRSVLKLNEHVLGSAAGDLVVGLPVPMTVGTGLGAGTVLGTSLGTLLGYELASCELTRLSVTAANNSNRPRYASIRRGPMLHRVGKVMVHRNMHSPATSQEVRGLMTVRDDPSQMTTYS